MTTAVKSHLPLFWCLLPLAPFDGVYSHIRKGRLPTLPRIFRSLAYAPSHGVSQMMSSSLAKLYLYGRKSTKCLTGQATMEKAQEFL